MIERQDIKLMIDRLEDIDRDDIDSPTIRDAISLLEDLGNAISELRTIAFNADPMDMTVEDNALWMKHFHENEPWRQK